MNEIKEAYVSFEIAKLLKEKGFNIETDWYYKNEDVVVSNGPEVIAHPKDYYAKPTHQMALAWLREIKNIVIVPEIHTTIDPKDYYWGACIYYLDKPWDLVKWMSEPSRGKYEGYNTVIESAIKYSLENLI